MVLEGKKVSVDEINIPEFIELASTKTRGKEWLLQSSERHVDDIYNFKYF